VRRYTVDAATQSRKGVLTLLGLPGVGVRTASVLAREFPTLAAVKEAAERGAIPSLRRTPPSLTDAGAWREALSAAERTLEQAAEQGVLIYSLFDVEFPELLRTIQDPPLVLFVKGQLRHGRRSAACIGTREPSSFGVCVTQRITRLLTQDGWSIVSGLAVGIDTEAHREALAAGGHTVAVLANGLDKIYPRENKKLAEDILAGGGALVSEQPFGVPATASNLVQRDRLQCGMSLATFVMQTDIVGGSMHTVRFTLTQGRLLYAPVPTGVHAEEEKSRGIVALTSEVGTDLVARLKNPPDEYRELLCASFRNRPPARAIRGRDDYPEVLRELDAALRLGPDIAPNAPAPDGNHHVAKPRGSTPPQASLF
jgi:DNA processing protein